MRAVSTVASGLRHSAVAIAEALLVAAIIAALLLAISPVYKPADFLAGTDRAQAAKPSSGQISVPDGFFGSTTVATVNPGGSGVWVHTQCHQNGGLALDSWLPVDSNNQASIQLGPTPSWTSGGATCTADEVTRRNGRWRTVASTSFNVAG